jgi:single-strand DNA-binding protein
MSLNKVILIGNVGKDPDVKYFDNGNVQANLTVATNERGYTLPNGTQVPERTDWHNVVVRRDQATFVEKHVKKGSSVLVEGKLRYRDYEKDGIRRYITEIIADRIEFYGSPRRPEGAEGTQTAGAAPQATPVQAPVQPTSFNAPTENSTDDLPF